MTMMPIYLICGVPGSGKTWVCEQLASQFTYVPHDSHKINDYGNALISVAKASNGPVIGEAPFRISVLIDELKRKGATVRPYFIIEAPFVVKSRYEAREQKPIPQQHLTRIRTVMQRARQYRAPSGTSEQILAMLKGVNEMASCLQESY